MSKNNKSAYNLRKCCFPDCCSKRESIPLVCIPKKGFEEWARLVSEHYGPAKNKYLSPFSLLLRLNPCVLHFQSEDFMMGPTSKKAFSMKKNSKPCFFKRASVNLAIVAGICGPPGLLNYETVYR